MALVAVVAVAALGFFYWGNRASAADYMTAKVERGNLRNTVTATGALQAVTTVQVGSQASGTISALYADFNSVVKKDQVLAELEPSLYEVQVAVQQANIARQDSDLAGMRVQLATEQRVLSGSIAFNGRPIDIALHPSEAFFAVLNQGEVFLATRAVITQPKAVSTASASASWSTPAPPSWP